MGEVVYNDNKEIESKSLIFYLFKTTGEKQLLFKYNKFDNNNNRTKVDMDSLNEFLKEINSFNKKIKKLFQNNFVKIIYLKKIINKNKK